METTDDVAKMFNQDCFFRPQVGLALLPQMGLILLPQMGSILPPQMGPALPPQMRFFAAKALAGAILVDVTSNTAIMINTRKSIVALVWSTRITKVLSTKGVPAISTNPPVNSRVQEHLGVSIQSDEGTNWNIGTKSFNDLVMSSIHSHTKRAPELGPSAGKSVISEERGRHVQIFLNRADYQDAEKIALDEQAASILDFDILQQLRRVRSKFKQFSAYIPSRASSSLCDFHRLEPQTVFTYSSFENGAPDGDGRRAPRLFAHVAHEVIRKKENALLEQRMTESILSQCKSEGRIAKRSSPRTRDQSPGEGRSRGPRAWSSIRARDQSPGEGRE